VELLLKNVQKKVKPQLMKFLKYDLRKKFLIKDLYQNDQDIFSVKNKVDYELNDP